MASYRQVRIGIAVEVIRDDVDRCYTLQIEILDVRHAYQPWRCQNQHHQPKHSTFTSHGHLLSR